MSSSYFIDAALLACFSQMGVQGKNYWEWSRRTEAERDAHIMLISSNAEDYEQVPKNLHSE